MRFPLRLACCAFTFFAACPVALSQSPPPRDPRALVLLQQSLAAMGGVVPADSVATGTVTITAGSKTDTGTIRILTRGLSQSVEEFDLPDGKWSDIFSGGLGAHKAADKLEEQSLEWACSAQSASFPLVLISSFLNNPDSAFEYVGLEESGGAKLHHIRITNTFASNAKLKHLSEFSIRDLWLDAASGLPRRLSYERRAAGGAEPRIPMEVRYSDFRTVAGILYPFRIEKDFNGTPWATIKVSSVTFSTSLTDLVFAVRAEGRPE